MPDNNDKTINYLFYLAILALALLTIAVMDSATDRLTQPPIKFSADGAEINNCPEQKCCIAREGGCLSATGAGNESEETTEKNQEQAKIEQNIAVIKERIRRTELAAQRGMWRATNALVHLTVWQILFGAVTLFFVAWTLKETRATTKAAVRAAEAAENSSRAYIFVEYNAEFVDESEKHFRIIIKIRNYGLSPASNVECLIKRIDTPNVGLSVIVKDVDDTFPAIGAGKCITVSETEAIYAVSDYDKNVESKRLIFSHFITYRDAVTRSDVDEQGCFEVFVFQHRSIVTSTGDTQTTYLPDGGVRMTRPLVQIGIGPKILIRPADGVTAEKYKIDPDDWDREAS